MEEVVMAPPVLMPSVVPERVECRLVGEVAPLAELFEAEIGSGAASPITIVCAAACH
jgi:hypothetical protein